MTMLNNWFDDNYGGQLAKADAKEALKLISQDERVLSTVQEAIDEYDKHERDGGWAGPSRPQAIRCAVAAALNGEEY